MGGKNMKNKLLFLSIIPAFLCACEMTPKPMDHVIKTDEEAYETLKEAAEYFFSYNDAMTITMEEKFSDVNFLEEDDSIPTFKYMTKKYSYDPKNGKSIFGRLKCRPEVGMLGKGHPVLEVEKIDNFNEHKQWMMVYENLNSILDLNNYSFDNVNSINFDTKYKEEKTDYYRSNKYVPNLFNEYELYNHSCVNSLNFCYFLSLNHLYETIKDSACTVFNDINFKDFRKGVSIKHKNENIELNICYYSDVNRYNSVSIKCTDGRISEIQYDIFGIVGELYFEDGYNQLLQDFSSKPSAVIDGDILQPFRYEKSSETVKIDYTFDNNFYQQFDNKLNNCKMVNQEEPYFLNNVPIKITCQEETFNSYLNNSLLKNEQIKYFEDSGFKNEVKADERGFEKYKGTEIFAKNMTSNPMVILKQEIPRMYRVFSVLGVSKNNFPSNLSFYALHSRYQKEFVDEGEIFIAEKGVSINSEIKSFADRNSLTPHQSITDVVVDKSSDSLQEISFEDNETHIVSYSLVPQDLQHLVRFEIEYFI